MAPQDQQGKCPFRFPDDFPTPEGRPLDLADAYEQIQRNGGAAHVILPNGETAVLAAGHRAVRTALQHRGAKREFNADAIPPWPKLGTALSPREMDPSSSLLLALDGDNHRTIRGLVRDEFSREGVERHRPHIEGVVDATIDSMLAAGTQADLFEDFGLIMSLKVIGHVMGMPEEDLPQFREWSDELLTSSEHPERQDIAQINMGVYMLGLIEQRRQSPGDDLVSRVIERAAGSGVPDTALAALFLAIFVGGWETTAGQIACGTIRLTTNQSPDGNSWWSMLATRPELLSRAVEESIRMSPSSRMGATQPRRADESFDVGNLTVEEGQLILAVHDAGGRDARAFPDPGRFDPLRDRTNHLAFAFGPHNCLGSHLARLELTIAFGALTRRMPDLRLAVPMAELLWDDRTMVRRPVAGPHGALPVTWAPEVSPVM